MNKIKELKIDKKKYLDIAIIFACIIAITLVGTFALKLWTSTNNTELTFRIGEYSTEGITCKSGEDITVSNIGPVFDYEKDGEVITFRAVAASSNTTPLNVSFNISTITDNLKETSFKYVLMSSTDKTNYTEILKGDFSNINSGSSIDLIKDKVITKTTYYKLIIYIDGNMENPTSMQNGSLTGNVEMCIEGGDGDININSFKVDGVETTKFPLSSGYDIDTTCSDATITFDYKSQSYEISNISKSNAKCGIKYTTKTNKTYLNNYIKSLAGTTQGNGQLVNEQMDYTTPTEVNYRLSQSQYGTTSQYSASSYRATSGTTVTNAFTYSNNAWTSNPSNLTSNTFYHLKYTIPENGYYQLCYTLSSGSTNNDVYIYKGRTQIMINGSSYLSASSSSDKSGCVDMGNLSTSDSLRVVQYAYTTISTLTFYLNKMNTTTTHYDSYRYEGKNPNNYIYFNNELWRIIGVFDASSHGKTGEYLTKIIRNDSLGEYAWDKSGKNNWATSSLYNLLNTNYYNATDGTSGGNCYQSSDYITGNCDYTEIGLQSEYRAMVENVTWYLGGRGGHASTAYTAEEFYIGERDSTSVQSGNTASITGYIGLMYASDYGYSVLSSSCARTTDLGSYSTSACGGASWLKKETDEWTVTHRTEYSNSFDLEYDARLSTASASYGYNARPVLYLNSNVQKISGSGTIANPYKIGY